MASELDHLPVLQATLQNMKQLLPEIQVGDARALPTLEPANA